MSGPDQRLEEALRKVAAVFDTRLPDRLRLLEDLWRAFEDEGAARAEPLRRELHRLRGTAASYGYQALAQRLRAAEDLLRQDARAALRDDMAQLFARRWERDSPLV